MGNVKLDLRKVKLEAGSHEPDGHFCVMELAAYLAKEPWSDRPKCVSPVLGAFLRSWNDSLDDKTRQKLKPYARKVLNTAGDLETDQRRAWMATDWLVRTCTPAFLRLAKLDAEAVSLEALPELVDAASAKEAQPTIAVAGAAAWDAARAAAGAAAWAAAWTAAWAGARAAAGDAARDALKLTTDALKKSAQALLIRMIEVRE